MNRINRRITTELKWFSFVIIPLALYSIFFLAPSLSAVYYSFTDWNGITAKFVGFDNYLNLFKEDKIIAAFRNTIFFSITITVVQNVVALFLAIFMNMKFKSVSLMRTLFFMPAIFSTLVISFVWKFILEPTQGLINTLLANLNMNMFQQDWVGDPTWSKWAIIIVALWQYTGYNMVIYLAGLQNIPKEMEEAADVDGAGSLRRLWNITFPLIAPAFTINVVLNTIGSLKIFDQIIAITNGGPGYETESIATMIYRLGFGPTSEWGYGTAMSVVMFTFIMALTVIQIKFLRKREVSL